MKKIIMMVMGVLLITLVACGTSNNNQTAGPSEGMNEEEQAADKSNEYDETDSGESEMADEKKSDDKNIEEYGVIEEHIDLDKYEMDVKEDNPHKRIILYETEQGEKEYKSIFLKDEDRLKIIEFNHGQIFNEVINS